MRNNTKTGDVYYSMEEIMKKFLPKSTQLESIERANNPYGLGVLLAKTNIKDIKYLLEKQVLVDFQVEADE